MGAVPLGLNLSGPLLERYERQVERIVYTSPQRGEEVLIGRAIKGDLEKGEGVDCDGRG
jgi:hypothetical protein